MTAKSNKPNILLIMSDEHDAAVTGCYGDSIVRTANLDQLAAEGVRFDNCYTNSPLCVPARQSFTAGKYISRIGVWNNECYIRDDHIASLPRVMNEAGYASFLSGKMHYEKTKRYGFTELFPANQSTLGGIIKRRNFDDESVHTALWEKRVADFHPGEHSKILDHDRRVTEHAVQFLRDRTADEGPFFLMAGYLAPHFPLIAPEDIYENYKDRVPMPVIPSGFLDKLPTNYKHLRRGFGLTNQTDSIVKKGREMYWSLVEWMDRQIGVLLDALRESAMAENTIVIYTSDHGENKGDHGLWWKNNMYEHSAKVPLIVHFPERWKGGQSREKVCSHVDLVRTLAHMAGAQTPEDWDGNSLIPYLDDEAFPWKDFAISEYYGHQIASGFTMYRTGTLKYVYHNRFDEDHPGERELYDLANDPHEFVNLADRPEWQDAVKALHAAMAAELGEEPDQIEQRCRDDLNGMRALQN